jgi:hypothetical protein
MIWRRLLAILAGALMLPGPRPASAQAGATLPPLGPQDMAPHRAGYTLLLSLGEDEEEPMQMTGRMSREVLAGCDGWTIRERTSAGTVGRISGQRFGFTIEKELHETWDGRSLRFATLEATAGEPPQRIAGTATLGPDGAGSVAFTAPRARRMRLPRGTLFPMAEALAVLNAARAGRRMLDIASFDGSSEDPVAPVRVMVGPWESSAPVGDLAALRSLGLVRVRAAPAGWRHTADRPPGSLVWANGVLGDIAGGRGALMGVEQRLVSVEVLPRGC